MYAIDGKLLPIASDREVRGWIDDNIYEHHAAIHAVLRACRSKHLTPVDAVRVQQAMRTIAEVALTIRPDTGAPRAPSA